MAKAFGLIVVRVVGAGKISLHDSTHHYDEVTVATIFLAGTDFQV